MAILSLRRFLVARLLWLILPIVLAVMVTHWLAATWMLRRVFDDALENKAKTLATLVTRGQEGFELEFADEFMREYSRKDQPFYFQVWLPDGATLERSRSLGGYELPRRFGSLGSPAAFSIEVDGVEVRCVGIEFPGRYDADGRADAASAVVVVLGADAGILNATLARGHLAAGITGGLSAIGITAVVLLTLRRGVRLLERVADDVRSIRPTSLVRPIDLAATPVEIRPIAASLNRSLERIHEFVERERRFNADVAHELRTPLTELRSVLEIARRWPDPRANEEAMEEAHAIALQMGSLVESLLLLNSLESESDELEIEEFDLAQSVGLHVDQVARASSASGRVHLDGRASLRLVSYPPLWEIVTRNLLENALEYSDPGSEVDVLLSAAAGGVRLSVSNRCTGLDPVLAERCTRRLWRGADSQAHPGHFGLGLSIVQAVCRRLGHRLDVVVEGEVFRAIVSPAPRADDCAPEAGDRP